MEKIDQYVLELIATGARRSIKEQKKIIESYSDKPEMLALLNDFKKIVTKIYNHK